MEGAKVVFAPKAELASAFTRENGLPAVSVEAEYGSVVVEGRLYTAAHHAEPYRGRPAPCNDRAIPVVREGYVLVSHVDLDTVGGCARALGVLDLFSERYQDFWELAEFVDTSGPHKLGQSGASEGNILRLHAYWAWAQGARKDSRFDFDRETVNDATEYVAEAVSVLRRILEGDEDLLQAGAAHRLEGLEFNSKSFVEIRDGVIVRVSTGGEFVNHLYATPSGEVGRAVVSLNLRDGMVRMSLESPVPGVSCARLLQELWGEEAGGHDGIGGSPRNERRDLDDLVRARDAMREALRRAAS